MATFKFTNRYPSPTGKPEEVRLMLPPSKSLLIRQIFLDTAWWIRLHSKQKGFIDEAGEIPIGFEGTEGGDDINGALALTAAIRLRLMRSSEPRMEEDPYWEAGEAGTVMRFGLALLAFAGLGGTIQGQGRAHQRPIKGLVDALRILGARIHYLGQEGYPPLRLEPSSLRGGRVLLPSHVSSQFASALLLGAVCREVELELHWGPEELLSRPYLDMTLAMLQARGWSVDAGLYNARLSHDRTSGRQVLVPEGDWSAAAFWILRQAAYPLASTLILSDLNPESLQGDAVLLRWLPWIAPHLECVMTPGPSEGLLDLRMRVRDGVGENALDLEIDSPQQPVEWEHKDGFWICHAAGFPDLVPALTVWAVLRGIRLQIRGVGHLIYKESDRLQALSENLQGMGVPCRVLRDEELVLMVDPAGPWSKPREGEHRSGMGAFRSYGDHRMVMAMSMLALPGWNVFLDNARVVTKSYPNFWEHWGALGYELEE